MDGVAIIWYERAIVSKEDILSFTEDILENPKMYAKANKHKNMYLTSATAVNLSSCFLFESSGT